MTQKYADWFTLRLALWLDENRNNADFAKKEVKIQLFEGQPKFWHRIMNYTQISELFDGV